MEDREDDHHQLHRVLQEADPRQARQVPGHGPEDRAEWVFPPSPLPTSYLTRSVQRLGSRWTQGNHRFDGASDPHPEPPGNLLVRPSLPTSTELRKRSGAGNASGAEWVSFAEREDEVMTRFRRHFGRRAAGVGVAAALVVLGLETPAFAVPPTITSFSPTSGPAGCVVVITGTDFDNPDVSSVDIGGTPVTAFKIVSGTKIWATVAGTTSGTIHVTNASDTASSPTDFTNTNPGACSPTITQLTPCSGSAGTTVLITGKNLLASADPATTQTDVRFAPYAALAAHTTPNAETPTRLSVVVPSDAADGPIRVSTFNDVVGEGAVLSGTAFQVPPPDGTCPHTDPFPRSITLSLQKHLVTRGKVSVGDGFTDCAASVPVRVQRRVSGQWRTVGRTTTTDTGAYRKRIRDRAGRYRALAPNVTLASGDVCPRAVSLVRRHSH